MNWFSSKPTAKEAALEAKKDVKRTIRSNQRELDRTLRELDKAERQTLAEIKKHAKKNPSKNDPVLKSLAKQLVQIRAQRDSTFTQKAQISAVGMNANRMASQVVVASSVEAVGATMKTVNSTVDTKEISKTMAEFMKENERMNIREELLDDMLGDVFDADGMVEEEAEDVTNQVLAELGLELDGKMDDLVVPTGNKNSELMAEQQKMEEEDKLLEQLPDLQSRLNAL